MNRASQSWRDVHGDIAWLLRTVLLLLALVAGVIFYIRHQNSVSAESARNQVLASYKILVEQGNRSELLRDFADLEVIREWRKEDAMLGKIKSFKLRAAEADYFHKAVVVSLDVKRRKGSSIEELTVRGGKILSYSRAYPRKWPR